MTEPQTGPAGASLEGDALRVLYADWSEILAGPPELTMRLLRSVFDEWHQPTREPEAAASWHQPVPRSASGEGARPAAVVVVGRLCEQEVGGAADDLGAGAAGVVGGEEVAADGGAEGEQAAGLDLVGVGAEGADHRAQQCHALVVHAPQALGD